jgi:hypothetical protein
MKHGILHCSELATYRCCNERSEPAGSVSASLVVTNTTDVCLFLFLFLFLQSEAIKQCLERLANVEQAINLSM